MKKFSPKTVMVTGAGKNNCISSGAIGRNGKNSRHMAFPGENGHGGTPKDISDTVLFSSSQHFITGQNFVVDGGRTLDPDWR